MLKFNKIWAIIAWICFTILEWLELLKKKILGEK